MGNLDLSLIHAEEAFLARVLLKNKIVKPEDVEKYVGFKKMESEIGKAYLGELLIKLGVIKQAVMDEFIEENDQRHLEFCGKLAQDGFFSKEQNDLVVKTHNETGKDVITVLSDKGIMTRDTFARIFNQKTGGLKLGEWLVLNRKVSQVQIDKARKLQTAKSLEEFLVINGSILEQDIKKVKDKIAAHSK